jgi:hypothetical protein
MDLVDVPMLPVLSVLNSRTPAPARLTGLQFEVLKRRWNK